MIGSQEIMGRREALVPLMRAGELDAIVVASEGNVQYLTGYETTFFSNTSKPFFVVVEQDGTTTAICHQGEQPSLELDGAELTVLPYSAPDLERVGDIGFTDYHAPAVRELVATLKRMKVARAGFELTWHFLPALSPAAFELLRSELEGHATLEDASPLLWKLRIRKSPDEIAILRRAAEMCGAAHEAFAERARIGMSERELSSLLRACAYELGAERIAYTGTIAGVDRAPLGGPTDRVWQVGQLLEVDLCLKVRGYFSDFCRIYAADEPTGPQRSAYAALYDAVHQQRGSVRSGAAVRDVSRAGASVGESPYDRNGHGLGLEMPEPPSLTPLDDALLTSDTVICTEPNVYFDGVGWLVAEETGVVRDDGYELLSPPFPRELGVIDRR